MSIFRDTLLRLRAAVSIYMSLKYTIPGKKKETK